MMQASAAPPNGRFLPSQHFLVLLVTTIVLMAPAFYLGGGGSDLHCQSLYTRYFSQQFWHGELYPRWLQGMDDGTGSPVFFYYPPIAYYINAMFVFLAPLDQWGYYPIAASTFLAVLVSGLTFYVWVKEEGCAGEAALVGSMLYMAVPHHVADNFYTLLLFSSAWGYAWVPLMLMFAKKLADREPYALIGFAVSLCLMVMTNFPMTLLFGPIACAYNLAYWRKREWFRQGCMLAASVLLGFGLAAISFMPAMMYQDYACIDMFWKTISADGSLKKLKVRDMFFMNYHTTDCTLHKIYWYVLAVLTPIYIGHVKNRKVHIFFFLLMAGTLFLMLPASTFIWKTVTILTRVQMSERLFAITSVCIAVFIAFAYARLRWISYGLIGISVIVTYLLAYDLRMPTLLDYKKVYPQRYEEYLLSLDQFASYLTSFDLFRLYSDQGRIWLKGHPDQVNIVAGSAQLEVKQWEPRAIKIYYKSKGGATLQLRQFDYPGFKAAFNGKNLDITRDAATGRIEFDVPAGEGYVTVNLTKLAPEIAGERLSALSAGVLMLLFLLETRRRKAAAAQA